MGSSPSAPIKPPPSRDGGLSCPTYALIKSWVRLLHDPEIITRGYVSPEEAERLIPIVQKKVVDIVNGGGLDNEKTIINAVRSFLYNETKRRPMVFVTLSKT